MATGNNCCCEQDNLETTSEQVNSPPGEKNHNTAIYILLYVNSSAYCCDKGKKDSQTQQSMLQTGLVENNEYAAQFSTR